MDWWDERLVKLSIPAASSLHTARTSVEDSKPAPPITSTNASATVNAQIRITCTPSQHTSGRTGLDRWSYLWASYVLEELLPPSSSNLQPDLPEPPTSYTSLIGESAGLWSKVGKKVYFAGDTGYKTVRVDKGETEEGVREVCPAFGEVGERWGGVDGALLPIGCVLSSLWSLGHIHSSTWTDVADALYCRAYSPREMWSNLHASPADAVRMMKDVKAKKGLAMHWGCVLSPSTHSSLSFSTMY